VRDEAIDLSNVALLLFTDDTPVFNELIILINPSKIPPFPADDDDDALVPAVPVPLDESFVAAAVVVAAGTVPVADDSLLVEVGTGC
jgi:hypothetical protein